MRLSHVHTRFTHPLRLLALLALLLTALPTGVAQAASFAVTTLADSGTGSLRQAITTANTTAGADTITFSVNGTIVLASALPIVTQDLTISGPGAARLTISGNNTVRVMQVNSVRLAVDGVTIANGNAGAGTGGGIDAINIGTLAVSNSVFTGNRADRGAALSNQAGTLTVSNSTFTGNNAFTGGGAILNNYLVKVQGVYNFGTMSITDSTVDGNNGGTRGGGILTDGGTVTITRSTLSNNKTTNTSNDGGGGIYNAGGAITVNTSVFRGNSAANNGGAILNNFAPRYGNGSSTPAYFSSDGTVTVNNSTFTSNSATTYGGGIFHSGGICANTCAGLNNKLTVTNSTFGGNSASSGGAISNLDFASNTVQTVTNSTLSGNTASQAGGGIDNAGKLVVTNSTLTGNSAPQGGGINVSPFSLSSTLQNTIIANSPAGGNCYVYAVANKQIIDAGGNLSSDTTCAFTAASSKSNVDPKLGPLRNNGGPTQTHALQADSPAINAIATNACVVSTDQRGVARPQGSACDSGAFEATASPSVTVNQEAAQPDPTATNRVRFVVVFSEPVTGFGANDVLLAAPFSLSTANVTVLGDLNTPRAEFVVEVANLPRDVQGTLRATILAGAAINALGIGNAASTSTDNTVTYDSRRPNTTMQLAPGQSATTSSTTAQFVATFDEPVIGFAADDVALEGAAVTAATRVTVSANPGTANSYLITVSGLQPGTLIASIASGRVTDGVGNPNTPSNRPLVTVVAPTTVPTATLTPTPTNAATPTSTPTNTPMNTAVPTSTVAPTETSTPTNSAVPSINTPTATNAPTNTAVPPTATNAPTATATNTATSAPTATVTNTAEPTNTVVPPTNTAAPPTATATNAPTATSTPTSTAAPTATATNAPTATATNAPTNTAVLSTNTPTATNAPTNTATATNAPTNTPTATNAPTNTAVPSTNTAAPTATATRAPAPSATVLVPSATVTSTPAPTKTATVPTKTPTSTPIVQYAPLVIVTGPGACVSDFTGQQTISVSDQDTPVGQVTLQARSSNTTLVPSGNITFSGSGSTRTVTIASASGKSGTATVTITASDGTKTSTTTITVKAGTSNNDTLSGTSGTDMLFGGNAQDTLSGNGGNDLLCGGAGDDVLNGGDGNDTLDGSSGQDQLNGNAGNDTLRGGAGDDRLSGGTGADMFDRGDGNDIATDYRSSEGDTKTSIS